MENTKENKKLLVLGLSLSAVIFLLIVTIVLMTINNKSDFQNDYSQSIESGESFEASVEISVETSSEVTDVFNESVESVEDSDEIFHGWIINEYGYTYIYDNSGYEQFNYKASALNRYVNSINSLSEALPKTTRFFNITVPVSSTFVSIPKEIYANDNFLCDFHCL